MVDHGVRGYCEILRQDGSALQGAAERFAQVDVEHVRSIGPMVAQESMRRLCDMLFSRTQEANLLHTMLAGSHNVSLNRLHKEHPQILAAAKPILVATPATLAAITDPAPLADVVIIDAAAHIQSIELLSIISRAKQVVVIAHRETVTSDGLKRLIALLPSVKIALRSSMRSWNRKAMAPYLSTWQEKARKARSPTISYLTPTVCRSSLRDWWKAASRRSTRWSG